MAFRFEKYLNGRADQKMLYLSRLRFSPENLQRLSEFLEHNQTLWDLNLSWCNLDDTAIAVLVSGIVQNSTLRKINFSHNLIEDLGIARLCNALIERERIFEHTVDLNLASNQISPLGAQSIVRLLEANQISDLNLNDNPLQREGVDIIFRFLATQEESILKKLELAGHLVRSQEYDTKIFGGLYLFLDKNSRLEYLDLSDNEVNSQSIMRMSQCIMENENTKLQILKLGKNPIKNTGAGWLAALLTVNKTLWLLDLSYCQIYEKGLIILSDALRGNTTLMELVFTENLTSDVLKEAFLFSLTVNIEQFHALSDLDFHRYYLWHRIYFLGKNWIEKDFFTEKNKTRCAYQLKLQQFLENYLDLFETNKLNRGVENAFERDKLFFIYPDLSVSQNSSKQIGESVSSEMLAKLQTRLQKKMT